jgi:type VII secretion integral membrane protein EccD
MKKLDDYLRGPGAGPVAVSGDRAVTVTYRDKQIGLVLPFDQPISGYIGNVVDALVPTVDSASGRRWTLARFNVPINPTRSLADARVDDGATLALRAVTPTQRYRPVAEEAAAAGGPFDAVATRRAGMVGLAAGGAFVCAAQWRMWAASHLPMVWAVIGGVGALVALIGMWSAASRYRAPDAAAAWAAVWLVAAAAAGQWIPVSARAGSPGMPQLAVAAAGVCAAALCALIITDAHFGVFCAIAVAAGVVAVVAVVAQCTDLAASAIGAGVQIAGLVALSTMPRITVRLAQISLSPVPGARHGLDTAREFSDAVLVGLQARAGRAVQLRPALTVLTGGIVAAVAVWTLDPHSRYLGVEIPIVACSALILVLRGRTMTDLLQACALFTGAAVTVFASAGRLILTWPTGWRPVVVVCVVAAATAAWVIWAAAVSSRPAAPTPPGWVDRLEATSIALVIPLCAWVTGVFGFIRDVTSGSC